MCGSCNSYNTVVVDGPGPPDSAGPVVAPAVGAAAAAAVAVAEAAVVGDEGSVDEAAGDLESEQERGTLDQGDHNGQLGNPADTEGGGGAVGGGGGGADAGNGDGDGDCDGDAARDDAIARANSA
jgi:hypothetical protein